MKSKIQQVTGQRIGQLLWNALDGVNHEFNNRASTRDYNVSYALRVLSDEDLIRIVKDYLAERKTKEIVEVRK